jgi:hypothetical protein
MQSALQGSETSGLSHVFARMEVQGELRTSIGEDNHVGQKRQHRHNKPFHFLTPRKSF